MSKENSVKREHRFASEVRAVSTDAGKKLSGYAAVYNVAAVIGGQFNEVLRPGCFDACLAANPDVRALWGHSDLTVLGRTTAGTLRLRTDGKGLFYEIDLPDTQAANDLWLSVSRKDVTGSSFGFTAVKDNWIPAKPGQLPTREILAADVFDVSPCSYPAYESGTSVDARSVMPVALRDAGASQDHLGVVPFATSNLRSEDPFDSVDEANEIINWADGEDRADASVKNKLKASQGFAYIANDGSKRSDYLLPHHTIRDNQIAHSYMGALSALGDLATPGKADIPEQHRSEVRNHLLSELDVFQNDSNEETEIERSRARIRVVLAKS